MKGLLLKDFYFIMRKNTILLILSLLFTFGGAVVLSGIPIFSSAYMYGIFFFMMATMTTLTYDETTKWNIYCDTFPISRKTFVTEKYFFIVGSSIILWVVSSILILISNIGWHANIGEILNNIKNNLVVVMGMSVVPCIIFPLTFKFSFQKARIALLVLIGIYSGLVAMIISNTPDNESPVAVQSVENIPVTGIVIGVVACLCVISWLISVKVYSKREL